MVMHAGLIKYGLFKSCIGKLVAVLNRMMALGATCCIWRTDCFLRWRSSDGASLAPRAFGRVNAFKDWELLAASTPPLSNPLIGFEEREIK